MTNPSKNYYAFLYSLSSKNILLPAQKNLKLYTYTPILSAISIVTNCTICNCHKNDKKLSIFIYKNNLHKCEKYDNMILGEALWGQRIVHTLLSFVQVADEVDAKGATIGCRSFCISNFFCSNLPQSVLK